MELLSHSPEDTEDIGARLAEQLEPGAVVAFTGDLGRAKPPSPGGWPGAWVSRPDHQPHLHHRQRVRGGRLPLFHFDMYRLGSADELFDIGWEDYLRRGRVRRGVEREHRRCAGGGRRAGGYPPGASDQERVITIAGVSEL